MILQSEKINSSVRWMIWKKTHHIISIYWVASRLTLKRIIASPESQYMTNYQPFQMTILQPFAKIYLLLLRVQSVKSEIFCNQLWTGYKRYVKKTKYVAKKFN